MEMTQHGGNTFPAGSRKQPMNRSQYTSSFRRYRHAGAIWVFKRCFDFTFALLALIVLAVPMGIIAAIIALDSPGGPIYRQERLGKDGKPFLICKFRSMRMDAEKDGPKWAERSDDRCTRFGALLRKTRLDELPQLWNILKGEMSFVGPAPGAEILLRAV